jgi:hypothetical protein
VEYAAGRTREESPPTCSATASSRIPWEDGRRCPDVDELVARAVRTTGTAAGRERNAKPRPVRGIRQEGSEASARLFSRPEVLPAAIEDPYVSGGGEHGPADPADACRLPVAPHLDDVRLADLAVPGRTHGSNRCLARR